MTFEAISNFRDFGGYKTPGGRVARGKLFRSGQLSRATAADHDRLAGLGLTLIVDLRMSGECAREPTLWPDGFSATRIGQESAGGALAPHEAIRAETVDGAREAMRAFYGRTFHSTRYRPLFGRAIAALAETQGGALFHCAAGKDRTGLLCGLILRMLGVHRDDAVEDYLQTNIQAPPDRRLPEIRERSFGLYGRHFADETLLAYAWIEADYLDRAFAAIDARPGGLDRYLADDLGISPIQRRALEARLIV
jgi:protein tyrosine/serine phosphatase